MTLSEFCQQMTHAPELSYEKEFLFAPHLLRPEYSPLAREVKTYPQLKQESIFALCWQMDGDQDLYASLLPAKKPFSYRYSSLPNTKTQLHTHDYIELSYIVKGEFRQKIMNQEITFREGDFCLIDKNCLHQDYLDGDSATILFLGIANDMFSEIMNENITSQKIIGFLQPALLTQQDLQQYLHFHSDNNTQQEMEHLLLPLLTELQQKDIGFSHICRGLLMRIFHLLGTRYEISLSKAQKRAMSWLNFEEISAYIRQHSDSVTIQELCRIFHFQEDYFNRLIRSKTGMTYSTYVQDIRLEKASQLLTSSVLTIEEICETIGYHNKGYFYKIFQEKYGMTPAKYRKRKTP